ncbi:MAG: mannose-1-phosphate guanylyltransferase [Proteobacteria bacterium SG_bin7]|nr:MAG: mannose-1-phosphate guanylyltransferase [Proteobacteria bacterium SG_bin7]
MKAILLAAGLGTRLRPVTDKIPKCLVPINDKPLMDYWLEMLGPSEEINGILVNTHYLANVVDTYLRNSKFAKKIKIVFEPELLGTGGTVVKNKDFVQKDRLFLAHADNLTFFDLHAFIHAHKARPKNCVMTMMTFTTPTPESCGIVGLDTWGVVQNFYEKVKTPPSNLANAAVYIMEPEVVNYMVSLNKAFVDISTEIIPKFMGRIFTYHNKHYHRDIGTIESLDLANKELSHLKGDHFGRNEISRA